MAKTTTTSTFNYNLWIIDMIKSDPSKYDDLSPTDKVTYDHLISKQQPIEITEDMILADIKLDWANVTKHIDKLNENIILFAVSRNFRALEFIRKQINNDVTFKSIVTEQILLKILNKNPEYFEMLPNFLKTKSLISKMLVEDGLKLKFVMNDILKGLEKFQNEKGEVVTTFKDREDMKNCLNLAINSNGLAIKTIIDKSLNLVTNDMCKKAVSDKPWAFYFLPDNLKTQDIIDIITNNSNNLNTSKN